MNKIDAQKRINRILAFREELAHLQSEQIAKIPNEETDKIAAYHQGILNRFSEEFDTDSSFSEANLSIGMQIASTLGAIAFSAALFLMIDTIWPNFSDLARLVFGTALPFIGIALTEAIHRIFKTPYYTGLAALTAIAGFTGSLFILGYQYNLGSSPLSLIMLGAFGVALSLQYRLILPFFLSIIGTLTGVGGLLTESFSQNLWLGADLSETYLIPALIVMGMAAFIPKWRTHYLGSSLYNASAIVAGFLILFFIISPAESYLPFGETANSWLYAIAGTSIGIGSVFLALKSEWLVTRHLATAFMLAVLIIKYIDLAWGKLPEFLFYLLFGLFAVGCIIILRRFRTRLKGASS
ncbi:MAG: DUF2157 domain-containing protein [Sneathiella sp.]|nr:DUF2157 domain-containing protein [Sneathiella sp.]